MQTLIQQQQTGFYRTKRGWTPHRVEALDFATSLQALDYCVQNNLREVVLILKLSDPRFDVCLQPFPSREAQLPNSA